MKKNILFNDISSGDIVTKEHMIMLLTDYVLLLLCLTYDYVTNVSCSFVTMSFKAATMSSSGNKSFK